MEPTKSNSSVENDVLHLGAQSKLTPEEIAKAIAHHNRHHGGGEPHAASVNVGAGKKGKKSK